MRTNRTAAVLSTFGALALTAALFTSPAGATDRDGDADSDAATSYTEDNDNDGTANNIEDDGDNAHPSGNDRSVERGGSGTQGKSESEPDDDGHGPERDHEGTDKPNGPGGVDKLDQDGNNGCGNDDDFEDDNEGWCGNKPEKPESETDAAGVATECQKGGGMTADANDQCGRDECAKAGSMTDDDDAKSCGHSNECAKAGAMTDDDDATTCGHSNECAKAGVMTDDDDAKTCDDDDASACTDAAAMTDDDDDDESCVVAAALGADAEALAADITGSFGGGLSAAGGAAVLSSALEAPASDTDSGVLSSVSAGAAGALAFTGDHIMLMVVAALLALVAGTVMVRQTRRTHIEA